MSEKYTNMDSMVTVPF